MLKEMFNSNNEEFLGGMGGLQTMGILNALRTGNPTVDMLLAMCFPFVLRFLIEFFRHLECLTNWQYWRGLFTKESALAHRYISHKRVQNYWGGVSSLDGDTQNTILLKAIQLYMHSVVKLDLPEANLTLTSTEDKESSLGTYNCSYDDESNSEDERESKRTIAGILSKYKIIKNPIHDQWHELGSFGKDQYNVRLRISCNQEQEGGDQAKSKKESTMVYHFTSQDAAAIDEFIANAYNWYLVELRKQEDHSRYLYELKSDLEYPRRGGGDNEDEIDSGGGEHVFKRYRLSDEKTFDSLFFQQKAQLLKLIQHFNERTGKYAIKGYPHKLGILLHGAPGTGKVS